MKDKKIKIIEMSKKIEEYRKDPIVIDYLELVGEYEKLIANSKHGVDKQTDDEILLNAIRYIKIKESNNIYVYMGSFLENYECDIEDGPKDYMVSKDNPNAYYRVYRNLELNSYQEGYEVGVLAAECEKFEQENIVIYPEETKCSYMDLRKDFFKTAISDSQENALKKVISLRCVPKK